MSRKYKIILISVTIAVLAASVFLVNYLFVSKTNINESNVATLTYDYQDSDILIEFTQDEKQWIYKTFNNKELFLDMGASCGFSDHLSISFGTDIFKDTFYPACDGCYTIKYRFKIFHLTEEEGKKLYNILRKYGVCFPCL